MSSHSELLDEELQAADCTPTPQQGNQLYCDLLLLLKATHTVCSMKSDCGCSYFCLTSSLTTQPFLVALQTDTQAALLL